MKISKNQKFREFADSQNSKKIIAGIFTVAILGLILFAGPVKAFILGLDIDGSDDVIYGEEITFIATLDIENIDKRLPIQELRLHINGPTSTVCTFDINGNEIDECENITITRLHVPSNIYGGYGYGYGYDSTTGYGYDFGYGYGYEPTGYGYGYDSTTGYGYGYGYGNGAMTLKYEIILDTTGYSTGDYESQLKALIGGKLFASNNTPNFTINPLNITIIIEGGGSGNGNNPKFPQGNGFEFPENNFDNLLSGEDGEIILTSNDKKFVSRITGAVVGFTTSGTGILTLVVLIVLTGSMIIIKKRRK